MIITKLLHRNAGPYFKVKVVYCITNMHQVYGRIKYFKIPFFFQINFFKDHTKIIICPLLGGVTYIDEQRRPRTYNLEMIEKYGCSAELASRLTYTLEKVETMLKGSKSTTSQPSSQVPSQNPVSVKN
jgi:hypothetical protein